MSKKSDMRADRIVRALLRAGNISVQDLVDQIGTPAHNIRRDLARLEERGLALRTRGGATLVEPLLYEPFRHDVSFPVREFSSTDEKRRIGLAASELISEGETIGLMAGTTATHLARALRHRQGISVITNAVNIAMELCNQPAIKTTLTGGPLALSPTFALMGQPTLNALKEVFLDRAFISAAGIDVERGVTTVETEEAIVSRAMIQQACQIVVLADSSKIGRVSPALICPLSKINVLVTDESLPRHMHDRLMALGIKVICA